MHAYLSKSFPVVLKWGIVADLMLKMYNNQRTNGCLWTHIEIWHKEEYSVIEMSIAFIPVIVIIAITALLSYNKIGIHLNKWWCHKKSISCNLAFRGVELWGIGHTVQHPIFYCWLWLMKWCLFKLLAKDASIPVYVVLLHRLTFAEKKMIWVQINTLGSVIPVCPLSYLQYLNFRLTHSICSHYVMEELRWVGFRYCCKFVSYISEFVSL